MCVNVMNIFAKATELKCATELKWASKSELKWATKSELKWATKSELKIRRAC